MVSDFFACATAGWMTVAVFYNNGISALVTSVGAEAVDFFGSYLVGRAFFLGPTALHIFIRVLKIVTTAAIILGMLDTISEHLFIHDIFASIIGAQPPNEEFRMGMIRAMAAFDHEILFGSFCAIVAAILLYSEVSALRRVLWAGLCCLGCILSLTSAALLSVFISLAACTYDRFLRQHRWRWIALWIMLAVMIVFIVLISENPIRWIILHLTMEPQHGYYRLMVWNLAMDAIPQSPLLGIALTPLN